MTIEVRTHHDTRQTNTDNCSQSATSPAIEPCVICLEPIHDRAIAVPCNHYTFDFICLASWLQDHQSCPLCAPARVLRFQYAPTDSCAGKTPLTSIEYDFRSPTDYKSYKPPQPTHHPTQPSTAPRPRPYPRRPQFSRRRPQRYIPTQNPPSEALLRRRHIYRHALFSLHVGSNRHSRYRDFTPPIFARSPDLQRRAKIFIRRELQVFDFLSPDAAAPPCETSATAARGLESTIVAQRRRAANAEFLLEYVVSILKTVDVKDSSGKAEGMMAEFLGTGNARLFLHELEAWLRSPFERVEDWDRCVQYREDLRESEQLGLKEEGEVLRPD